MRKTYSKPLIECAVVNTEWALCGHGGTTQQNNQTGNTGSGEEYWGNTNPSPKRVF